MAGLSTRHIRILSVNIIRRIFMSFIRTIPEYEAAGEVKKMYDSEKAARGYLPNFAKTFSLRPKVMEAWRI
jgi:hypothetical protein